MGRGKALKDWGGYATSQYVARLAELVRGFVVAKLLGPAEFGRWQAILMIYDLGSRGGHLGILNGMDREIPFHLGKGDRDRAATLRDAGYTAVLGITTLILAGLLLVDLIGWGGHSAFTRFALPVVGAALLLQIQNFLFYNIFRAHQKIGPISAAWAIQALLNLTLSITLVLKFGVYGIAAALLISNFITFLFLRAKADWKFAYRADREAIVTLLKRGAPMVAFLMVEVLLRQTDRLVIIGFLSRTELGYYSIASSIAGLLVYVTSSASFTLFPELLSRFGKSGEIAALGRTLREPTFAFSIFVPVFLGFVYLWIHIPVVHILPKFVPGIEAMRVLVCGTLFLSISSLPSYFLITVNRTKILLIGGGIIIVLEAILGIAMVKLGYGIRGVAAAAALCQFLYGTTLLTYALRLVPEPEESPLLTVVKTYLPSVYVAGVVALLFTFLPIRQEGLSSDIVRGIVHGAILAAATAPLWITLQKRTGVFTLAWSLITKRNPPE